MYFDGGCPLCHREVAFYEKLDHANKVNFIDISALATPPPGLITNGVSLQHAMERIHVLDNDEGMVSGAKAFLSLWKRLPYFHLLVPLFHLPGVLAVTEYAYCYFAKNRLAATGRCNPHNRE
jgi:predicted DCC family thiol-disulfide oxidoreductase YuxK